MTLITRNLALCIPVGAEKGGYPARTSALCHIRVNVKIRQILKEVKGKIRIK